MKFAANSAQQRKQNGVFCSLSHTAVPLSVFPMFSLFGSNVLLRVPCGSPNNKTNVTVKGRVLTTTSSLEVSLSYQNLSLLSSDHASLDLGLMPVHQALTSKAHFSL